METTRRRFASISRRLAAWPSRTRTVELDAAAAARGGSEVSFSSANKPGLDGRASSTSWTAFSSGTRPISRRYCRNRSPAGPAESAQALTFESASASFSGSVSASCLQNRFELCDLRRGGPGDPQGTELLRIAADRQRSGARPRTKQWGGGSARRRRGERPVPVRRHCSRQAPSGGSRRLRHTLTPRAPELSQITETHQDRYPPDGHGTVTVMRLPPGHACTAPAPRVHRRVCCIPLDP